MLNICIFAGTTEGRKLAEHLSTKNIKLMVCVATEYGEELILNIDAQIHAGRLNYDDMKNFFHKNRFDVIIDATHPYASIVTNNISMASSELGINYIRLNRDKSDIIDGKYFLNIKQAVEYLSKTTGNILLTTGSKELSEFTKIPNFKERIYPRVLPLASSLDECKNNGYISSHIIAMQGPFTEELNKAIIKAFNIEILVTKEAGDNGGFLEKIKAAKNCEVEIVVIDRPKNKEGKSFDEVMRHLDEIICRHSLDDKKINIIGIGVGNKSQMTIEAYNTIKNSDVIIGAERILESCSEFCRPSYCEFNPEKILKYINEHAEYKNISILMSGDVGFYSGSRKISNILSAYNVNIICGISSPIYMCSKLGISWEDVNMLSLHGRESNVIHSVKTNFRTFVIVGGEYGVVSLCNMLCEYNYKKVKLYVGERLSYEDEKITVDIAENLLKTKFDKLASVIIENINCTESVNIGISDDEFFRSEKIPMTKSEVRAVSISKLNISNNSIIYDIGAGSGSVSVEAGLNAYMGEVYAIEKNKEAIGLIEKNKIKFGVSNIKIIEGSAPSSMDNLPTPTHAFIGGSSGNLSDIIRLLLEKNKKIKIVINAVTLETVSEAIECIKKFNFDNADIVNLSVSKSKKIGNYNMMLGQNPIYIISCQNN